MSVRIAYRVLDTMLPVQFVYACLEQNQLMGTPSGLRSVLTTVGHWPDPVHLLIGADTSPYLSVDGPRVYLPDLPS